MNRALQVLKRVFVRAYDGFRLKVSKRAALTI